MEEYNMTSRELYVILTTERSRSTAKFVELYNTVCKALDKDFDKPLVVDEEMKGLTYNRLSDYEDGLIEKISEMVLKKGSE